MRPYGDFITNGIFSFYLTYHIFPAFLQREAGISNGMPASIYFRIILGKIGSNKLFSPSVGVRFILQFQQILQFFKHILLKFGTKLTE